MKTIASLFFLWRMGVKDSLSFILLFIEADQALGPGGCEA